MKQLERLKHIANLLAHQPQTIESITKYFDELQVKVSDRQFYRDLDDIKEFMLEKGEVLKVRIGLHNKKTWSIKSDSITEQISNFDINTYLISKITNPACLAGRKDSLEKIQGLLRDNLANSKVENNPNWDNLSLENTHFYEVPNDKCFQVKLEDILWSVASHYLIFIEEYEGDSVSLFKSITFPFQFNPIKIIYHRGGFFVAGFKELTNQILVLDVNQIKNYSKTTERFNYKKWIKPIEINLRNRFGITQNIDDSIYDISFEFSGITGQYVETHNWHSSQKFSKLDNGNYLMTMKCGINRELVGWIFQWMGNVKIVAPPILKELYNQHLQKIIALQEGTDLEYSNIFQPH